MSQNDNAQSIYPVPADFAAASRIQREDYERDYAASIADPDAYWGKIAQRLHDDLFAAIGRRLPGRAVARNLDGHAVFVVVAPAVRHIGVELIEVLPLDRLQAVGDALQDLVSRGIGADFARGALGVTNSGLEAGTVPLRGKPREPDAGLLSGAAAKKPDSLGLKANPEDIADAFKIIIDRIPPIIVERRLAIPAAGLFLGGI